LLLNIPYNVVRNALLLYTEVCNCTANSATNMALSGVPSYLTYCFVK